MKLKGVLALKFKKMYDSVCDCNDLESDPIKKFYTLLTIHFPHLDIFLYLCIRNDFIASPAIFHNKTLSFLFFF